MPESKLLPGLIDAHVLAMPDRVVESAWLGHIPFAKWLVDAHRPSITVELGVHNGASLCGMVEAAGQVGHAGLFYGVDHWIGDLHAGLHPVDVYWNLKFYLETRSIDRTSLMRMSFDDALAHFESGSIDLLHIDGLHTYEAVKHDFETWLPKLSRRGVVLFHDIRVRQNNFGVWQLWDELTHLYPAFDFDHSYGLGLIYVGSEAVPPWMNWLVENRGTVGGQSIRDYFACLGRAIIVEQEHAMRLAELARVRQDLTAARDDANQLRLSDLAYNRAIAAADAVVANNEQKIRSLRAENAILQSSVADANLTQAVTDATHDELSAVTAALRSRGSELEGVRFERDSIIAERNSALSDNDTIVLARQALEAECDASRAEAEGERQAEAARREAAETERDTACASREAAEARYAALLQWSVAYHDSTAASLSWKLTRPLRWLKIGRPKRSGGPPI